MLKPFMNKSSGHLEYLTVITLNLSPLMSLQTLSNRSGKYLKE